MRVFVALSRPMQSRLLPRRGGALPAGVPVALSTAVLVPLLFVGACQGDGMTSSPREDSSHFWTLELSDHAVTLSTTAPYDTVRVVAVPRTHEGTAIIGLAAPQYRSTNTDKVQVSADGLLIALAPTDGPVPVIAQLTADNLLHSDTVWVKVVDDPAPPVLTSFSIQPVPPDSAKIAAQSSAGNAVDVSYNLQHLVQATDANGASMSDVFTWFRSANRMIGYALPFCENQQPCFQGARRGTVMVYAQTNLFGVSKTDSLQFEVTWPLFAAVNIHQSTSDGVRPTFDNLAIRLAPGGVVTWRNWDTTAVEVAFADPTNVAAASTSTLPPAFGFGTASVLCFIMQVEQLDCMLGGNFVSPPFLTQFSIGSFVGRAFPVPGTYEYRSVSDGATAKVIVEE